MRSMRALWRRIMHGRGADQEFEAELASHIEMHIDDAMRRGLSREEARREALIKLGGAEQTRQAYRERASLPWFENLQQDVRFGVRMLAKSPGFTAVAVLTLALGVGANSAVFTITETALLRSWPAHNPRRLVRIVSHTPQGIGYNLSFADYRDLSAQSQSLDSVLVWSRRAKSLRIGNSTHGILDDVVSRNYFRVLGRQPESGRDFSASPDGSNEAIVSDALWRRIFHSDPELVGKQIDLTGHSYTVVGIGPPGFRGLQQGIPTDLWLPADGESDSSALADRKNREFEVLGRLRDGVSPEKAQSELATISARLASAHPESDKEQILTLISEPARLRQALIPTLILMATVGAVLLICCANVAGMLLARADKRRKEIAMRLALGASRQRLIRQLLTEGLLLTAAATALGLILAVGIFQLQSVLMPPAEFELGLDLHLDPMALVFTGFIALLSVVAFSLVPAFQSVGVDVLTELKADGQTGRGLLRRFTLRNAIVVTEIALSTVLLTASGLLVRSLAFSQKTNLGFDDRRQLLFFDLNPGIAGYNGTRSMQFFNQVQERISAIPGVVNAAMTRRVLLSDSGGGAEQRVSIPGVQLPQNQPNIPILFNAVGASYFNTVGTRILEGRAFTPSDNATSTHVVAISHNMAQQFWPGQDALGHVVKVVGKDSWQIVAVVEDAKINGIHEDPQPYMYFPLAQMPASWGTLVVQSTGNPADVTQQARTLIQMIDTNVPITIRTMDYLMEQAFWSDRISAGFASVIAALGLLLGAIGLYGVIATIVGRRSREIGIRLALGANRTDVLQLILASGLRLSLAGAAIGLLPSLALTRLLSSFLYGIAPYNLLAYATSTVIVVLVALAATWLPARRAASVDPM